uniref:Tumor necrosis factor-alpha n=1 Tax=Andrias davidianus TaxID=141262 RepID=A0A088S650_ANDDA|nr:tumor necrosis factor-alpha [Andrias davidianus]
MTGLGPAAGPPPFAAGGGSYPRPPPYNIKMPGPMLDPGPQAGMASPYPPAPQYSYQAPGHQPKVGMASMAPYPAALHYTSQAVTPAPPIMHEAQHTVIAASSNVGVTYVGIPLTTAPGTVVCPSCQQLVVTRTDTVIGLLPWLLCGGLVVLGLWIGCCLIPFCIEPLKDVNHFCPNCNHLIHRHKLM